ncbi:NAD(P)-binding protein [Eremomyces bilateralis CBS 781.70]|uniref:NAD(P)-binding protein n=1 Tax=Eremomyces bilateralis CBS 781.70 TaxID=1392243 RepID=A0A6G1FUB1_9PEZI|nr:NAD(P)-binding protein [Eremomyces bilateralis CBS 781.70]KAF1809296.1 NAD(P)-binding protein [Eremomyces bilateralis CBS 781.70]
MSSTIRAWTFTHGGYPSSISLATLPSPTSPPNPTTIHIRPHAIALNPVDIQLINLPFWSMPLLTRVFPALPAPKGIAADLAGTVVAAGNNSGFAVGDSVFGIAFTPTTGTAQELVEVDVGEGGKGTASAVILKKPEEWSWEQGAGLPLVWLTARKCVKEVEGWVGKKSGKGKSDEGRVVVLGGSSATGMYAVWLARKRGWSVLATCSGRNAEFVRGMGAEVVVDYTVEKVPEEVRRWGPDAVIDCVGGTECVGIANRYVTIVGDKTSRLTMGGAALYLTSPTMYLRWALGKAGLGSSYDCVNLEFNKEFLEEALTLPKDKIAIDSVWEFEQLMEAFERLNTGRARGKVIVKVAE